MNTGAPDAAVVGGGLVGLCTALALQRAGASTVLVRPAGTEAAASFGNAGHIAVEQVVPLANPAAVRSAVRRLFVLGGALDFRLRDTPAWGGWTLRYLADSRADKAQVGTVALEGLLREALAAWRRLTRDLDRPDLLIETGHLVVWESEPRARAGRAHWTEVPKGEAKLREMAPRERAALARVLKGPIYDGVGFEGTAQVASPAAILQASADTFARAGGQRIEAKARLLRSKQDRVGLDVAGRAIWPGLVVVAAGVGSGPLLKALGHAAPVVAERGYHVEAQSDGWAERLPPVVFEDRSMIVTRFGERLRAASFVEFARPDSPPDPRKWRRLERHVAELGLPMHGERSRWVGSRPTLPDYLPAIGRSRRAQNLLYAFGHQHLGLTLAPFTAELVADLAVGRAPAIPLEPFDLARFDGGRRRVRG